MSIINFFNLLDLRCHICNAQLTEDTTPAALVLCDDCQASFTTFSQQNRHFCKHCAMIVVEGINICKYCESDDEHAITAIDKTAAAYIYDFPIKQLILSLKKNPQQKIVEYFAQSIFLAVIEQFGEELGSREDVILIPMPIHANRIKVRGFNQSVLIAKAVAKKLKIKMNINLVIKTRDNGSQEGRNREERFRKVKNIFNIAENKQKLITGKTFILIDDVMTTGASLNELAKTLKKHNAKKCLAAVVARATFDERNSE